MLLVLAGAVLIGAGLAWLVIQNAGETRRLYAQQRESAQQLADALQARNDFIADASHELRTPLTVLRGNAEVGLTLEGGGLHRELFEDIVAESTRMTRLVEDLLFLARSDSRSLPLDLVSVEPESLMLRVTETAEALARQRNVTLVSRIAGEGQVRVDPARVEQAVQILVDNATKYGVSDKPIELSSYTSDGEFHIRVTDHGTGISATDLPRIFDRFYRVDRARVRKQGGAGLGLSIASSIIEAHGGRIEAHSQINQGTTMTITLPLVAAPTPDSTGTVRGE